MSTDPTASETGIVVEDTGGPAVLDVREVTLPAPAKDEVLVRHEMIGVNFTDIYQRRGFDPVPSPFTPGMEAAADGLGPIEVLQYSPVPAREFMKPVLDTTAEDLTGPIEQSVYGPVTAVQHVLPGLRDLGRGTILFINGGSAVTPGVGVAGTSIAFAGESAYGQMLHQALAPEGIHVAQLIIPHGIGGGETDHEPDALADRIWALHQERGEFRVRVGEQSK